MAKTKISEFSATPGNNTDIDGINIAEGCAPSGINDAIRELMSQLKDFQAGTAGDSFNGPVGTTTAAAGAFTTLSASSTATLNTLASSGATLTGGSINNMAIGGTTAAAASVTTLTTSSTVTLNSGTANGVAYLNGSKVLTTGSALTYNGSQLKISGLVYTNSDTDYLKMVNAADTTYWGRISQSGSDIEFYNRQAGALKFGVSDAEAMRLTSTGLGIGTSSPNYRLQVQSAGTGTTAASNIVGRFQTNGSGYDVFIQLSDNVANSGGIGMVGGAMYLANGTTRNLTLDSAGNLGLGVTPSASTIKMLQGPADFVIGTQSNGLYLTNNAYYNAGWKYAGGGAPSRFSQDNGAFQWHTAPSGTAGNAISFTQAMTLDASGNLGIGTSSPQNKLVVSNSGASGLEIHPTLRDFSTAGSFLLSYNRSGSAYVPIQYDASYHAWLTSNAERMRLDSSGNLGIGTSSPSDKLHVAATGTNAGNGYIVSRFMDSTSAKGVFLGYDTDESAGTIYGVNFLTFQTYNGSAWGERARIDSSGNLLVGTTSALSSPTAGKVQIAYDGGGASGNGLLMRPAADNGAAIAFLNAAVSQVGYIYTTSTATQYNTSSDYRLKENIQPMTGALAKVAALKPVTYTWKADGSDGEGFIAHELAEVLPQCVTGEKDAVDAEGKPVYQGIDTSFLVATLTAAIQEQQAIINDLRARVAQLEA